MQIHEIAPVRPAADMRVGVGTLWTLERHSHLASCTLIWLPRAWEVQIVMDDEPLLAKRCRRPDEVVLTAQDWRSSLRGRGWVDAA